MRDRVEVATAEGDRPAYRANGPDRCYHCKDELFTRIDADLARRHRLDAVAYGENADDARRPDRPGALAAREHGVLRPLDNHPERGTRRRAHDREPSPRSHPRHASSGEQRECNEAGRRAAGGVERGNRAQRCIGHDPQHERPRPRNGPRRVHH